MQALAESTRTQSKLETVACVLAMAALTGYVVAHLFQPLLLNQWIAGIICFTSDRVANGGPYYESPDSLCGATSPYPPAALFVHHGVTTITGLDPLLATRLLAIFVTAIYSILSVCVTVRLGVRFSFAASGFAFATYLLSLQMGYGGGMTLAGDLVVIACGMGMVLLAPRLEHFQAAVSVAILLALAFAFKAQGASLYVGVALFLASRPSITRARKLAILTCMSAGLLAVVALLASLPNCWEACIGAMGKHPRSYARLAEGAVGAAKYLWPFVVLPVLLVVLNLTRLSLARAWQSFQSLPAPTAMLLCLTPPYFAIQTAAMMKDGGGAYNLDLAVMLAIPLIILAGKLCGLENWQFVVLFAAVASAGLSRSAIQSLREIPVGSRLIEDSRSYLESRFPKAVVLYSADQYGVIGETSLVPTTDMLTVWHYLMAGHRLERVEEAVASQHYDLLIYPGLLGDSQPIAEFDKLLHKHYVPLVDDEIPAYLRGGLFVRRPPPH